MSRPLRSKEKKVVAEVASFFERAAESNGSRAFLELTTKATGVSRATVFRVRKELRETNTLSSPTRRARGPYKPIDAFDEMVIRNTVKDYMTQRRQLPTLRRVLASLKKDIDYPGCRETLRKTLKSLGFSWKRTGDNRKALMERPAVVAQRLSFYGKKKEVEDKGLALVYVDETWVDSCYTVKRCWQSADTTGPQPPCNRGQRLVVVHAGGRSGFIDGALLVYKASSSTGDYHSEMNGERFQKWLTERLLPNLKQPSAVVLDNASYHCMQTEKCPTASWKKADVQQWLLRHGLRHRTSMTKPQMLEIAKANKPGPRFIIDDLIRNQGHEVLRLPPYHPEMNAIELIWSQMKYIVRRRNITFRLDDLLQLTESAFQEIGEERWRDACDHVDGYIERLKKEDNYRGETLERVVIDMRDDSTDSDDDSETDTASEGEPMTGQMSD